MAGRVQRARPRGRVGDSRYSGSRVAVHRNCAIKSHFPQENATLLGYQRGTVTLEPL